jgi:hypothetical protein
MNWIGWIIFLGCFCYAIGKFFEFITAVWIMEEFKKIFNLEGKYTKDDLKEFMKFFREHKKNKKG